MKQDANAYGFDTIERLQSEFEADNFNIQNLMIRIATTAAFGDNQIAIDEPKGKP